MLKLVVVDRSAESRHRLVERLQCLLGGEVPDARFIPRVSVVPRALQEIKFHAAPDICIVGREIAESASGECAELRRALPTTPLIAELGCSVPRLGDIEQLARCGIDDVLPAEFQATELLQRLVLLLRKRNLGRSGQLVVVESAKGGLGVTSVAAGLADVATAAGKSAVLVDFDTDTQDAARFLGARPYLNEMLQQICELRRPLTQEFVEQCLVSTGGAEGGFKVVPPVPGGSFVEGDDGSLARTLLAFLEILDQMFDVTVIDVGSSRGAVRELFHRVADVVVLVVSTDPAALYATVEFARRLSGTLGPTARLVVTENRTGGAGLASSFVRSEIARAARLDEAKPTGVVIPYCARAALWPGSGETFFRHGGRGLSRAFEALWNEVGSGVQLVDRPVSMGEFSGPRVVERVRSFGTFALRAIRSVRIGGPSGRSARASGGAVSAEPHAVTGPCEIRQPKLLELPEPHGALPLDPRSLVSGLQQRLATVTEG